MESAATACIWPEDGAWAGMCHAGQRHACDHLGFGQKRMIGVAGAIAQSILRFRTSRAEVDWTHLVSDSDSRHGGLWTEHRPDNLWRRAATLVKKKFDPELGGDLWPAVCSRAADIRHRSALAEKPLEAIIHDEQYEAEQQLRPAG